MSFLDRFGVTVPPAPGVPARPAEDVRAALLAVGGPDMRYVVRDGTPEGADLVAEWQVMKPARKGVVARTQDGEVFQIRMRLVPDTHEVRTMDHYWEFTLVGDQPGRKQTRSHARGQIRQQFRGHDYGRGADGTRRQTESYRFDTAELKTLLQSTVTGAGWTWRGLRAGKP